MQFGDHTIGRPTRSKHSDASSSTPRKRLALFIDADNIPVNSVLEVISRLEVRFDVYYRRAYASGFDGGVEFSGRSGIKPVQTFPSVQGRAATDVTLVVDAMSEIQRADAICVASCDGDYAGLLQRLRENGKHVLVIGPAVGTSAALRAICNEFLEIEDPQLGPDSSKQGRDDKGGAALRAIKKSNSLGKRDVDKNLKEDLLRTFHVLRTLSIQVTMRSFALKHHELNPDFDIRNYRFLKGNPSAYHQPCDFTDFIRSSNVFKLTRIPGTRGAAVDYLLAIK